MNPDPTRRRLVLAAGAWLLASGARAAACLACRGCTSSPSSRRGMGGFPEARSHRLRFEIAVLNQTPVGVPGRMADQRQGWLVVIRRTLGTGSALSLTGIVIVVMVVPPWQAVIRSGVDTRVFARSLPE